MTDLSLSNRPAEDGVAGNERLTSMTGALLLVLLGLEILTVVSLRTTIWAHLVLGVVLAGPLVVKFASTGYRFVRYYTRRVAYVRRGPPALPLRLLAPALVAATIVLLVSGIALLLAGPGSAGTLVPIHNVTFLIWLPMFALHSIAYLARAWRATLADLGRKVADRVSGRGWRVSSNAIAVGLGVVVAFVLLPDVPAWDAWSRVGEPIPAPLIVGAVLSVALVLVARPRRWA